MPALGVRLGCGRGAPKALGELGAGGLVVNAVAADGVTEGIEHPAYKFCLGVQWHPEYHICPGDTALFAAFVNAEIP